MTSRIQFGEREHVNLVSDSTAAQKTFESLFRPPAPPA